MTLRIALITVLGLLLSTFDLYAQSRLDGYAKFRPMVAMFGDMETTNKGDDGWEFDETVGYGFELGTVIECAKGLRVELGLLALPNLDFEGARVENGSGVDGSTADLSVEAYAFMVDANWEFSQLFNPKSPYQAYWGIGLGVASVNVDTLEDSLAGYSRQVEGDNSVNFAYRFNLGIQYEFSTELFLNCSYSYLNLGGVELGPDWSDSAGNSGSNFTREVDLVLEAHVLQVGLTFVF